MKPDTSIGYPNGYQKDRKSNGLRGFSRETDRTGPKGYRDADSGSGGSLERLKTKNKTTKTGECQCLENSPRNN
jgi:hypothetical protein